VAEFDLQMLLREPHAMLQGPKQQSCLIDRSRFVPVLYQPLNDGLLTGDPLLALGHMAAG